MKKSFVTTVVAALVILLLTNGCASIAHNVYRQNQIRRSRVLASGNQEAIRAMSLGASPRDAMHGIQIRANNNEVAVMVDILDTSWVDAVKESQVGRHSGLLLMVLQGMGYTCLVKS